MGLCGCVANSCAEFQVWKGIKFSGSYAYKRMSSLDVWRQAKRSELLADCEYESIFYGIA